jgi:hypothetical protein
MMMTMTMMMRRKRRRRRRRRRTSPRRRRCRTPGPWLRATEVRIELMRLPPWPLPHTPLGLLFAPRRVL